MTKKRKLKATSTEIDRRDLLRGAGAVAATSLLGCDVGEDEENLTRIGEGILGTQSFPNPVSQVSESVTGVQGYSANSAIAGQQLAIKASADRAYDLRLVRPGWDVSSTTKDCDYGLIQGNCTAQGLRRGSYVHVKNSFSFQNITALSVECWVRPFRLNTALPENAPKWRGLVSQYSYSTQCGFGLFLDDQLRPACYFGTGGGFNSACLLVGDTAANSHGGVDDPSSLAGAWNHIVAVFNASDSLGFRMRLYLNGEQVGASPANTGATSLSSAAVPLRLGAYGESSATKYFLDGDIAGVAIYSRQLPQLGEVLPRYQQGVPTAPSGPGVEAWWNFSEENPTNVVDASGNNRGGIVINHGTAMVGGPGFDAAQSAGPPTTHALRLSRGDLSDCGWVATHSLSIPADTPAGLYVARFLEPGAAAPPNAPPAAPARGYDVPVVIRPSTTKPRAPIAVLAATNTWHAYKHPWRQPGVYDERNCTNTPVYYSGLNIPFLGWDVSGNPYGPGDATWYSYQKPGVRVRSLLYQTMTSQEEAVNDAEYYDHLLAAERPLHVWLERNGYEYDLLTDQDLLAHSTLEGSMGPPVVPPYRVLFIVGHSEYWTKDMVDLVNAYILGGGRVICVSGNTMFWRASRTGSSDEILEVRKGPPNSLGGWVSWTGELHHEDQLPGGLWRLQTNSLLANRAAWKVLGLDMFGYGQFSETRVVDPVHEFLTGPESTGLQVNDSLGGPNTVGHEFDVRAGTIEGHPEPLPSDYVGLSAPKVIASATFEAGDNRFANYAGHQTGGTVVNEIVDWKRGSAGGRVLNSGSIATAGAMIGLHGDPSGARQLSKFYRNALHAMGVEQRLGLCGVVGGRLKMAVYDGTAFGTLSDVDQGVSPTFDATKPPIGVMWAPNSLGVMAFDTAGQLQYNFLDMTSGLPSSPNHWEPLGNTFVGRPAAVAWSRNRLNVFAKGNNNRIYERVFNGSQWVPGWNDLGGPIKGDPAAIVQDGRRLSCAVVGFSDGHIYYKYKYADALWVPQASFSDFGAAPGGVLFNAVTLLAWEGNYVTLFGVAANKQVYRREWDGLNWTSWGQPTGLAGGAIVSRVAAARGGKGECALFGIADDNRLKWNRLVNGAWSGWQDLGFTVKAGTEPVATSFRDGSICVAITDSTSPNGWLRYRIWDGQAWGAWAGLGPILGSAGALTWVKS